MKPLVAKSLLVAGIAAALGMSGCSSMSSKTAAADTGAASDDVKELQAKVSNLESELASERAHAVALQEAGAAATGAELLPPNAQPGECYARVFIPPTYKTEEEQVLLSDASERVEVVPARYEWVEEQVLVKEASERLEVIPATYEWVEEQVLVKAAGKRVEVVPPTYETVTEQVLDKPEHTMWKKGTGPISKLDESTGEIMCLVTVPASYKTITKQVLVEKGGTREIEIPAEYKTVKKKIMKTPPTTTKIEIPAEYKTVKVKQMAEPPKTSVVPIPAKYGTVAKRIQTTEGHIEWRPVLCRTNTTPDVVRRIQTALDQAGHNPGPIDGVLGAQTMAAVKAYQQEKGLATGGITMKTLDALGVTP